MKKSGNRTVLELVQKTGCKPRKSTTFAMYSDAAKAGDRKLLDDLKQATGEDIHLSGEDAAQLLSHYRDDQRGDQRNFYKEFQTVRSWLKERERKKLNPVARRKVLEYSQRGSSVKPFLSELQKDSVDLEFSADELGSMIYNRSRRLEGLEEEAEAVLPLAKRADVDKVRGTIKQAVLNCNIDYGFVTIRNSGEEGESLELQGEENFEKALEISRKYKAGAEEDIAKKAAGRLAGVIEYEARQLLSDKKTFKPYPSGSITVKQFNDSYVRFNGYLRKGREGLQKIRKLARFKGKLEGESDLTKIIEAGVCFAFTAAERREVPKELNRFLEECGEDFAYQPIVDGLVRIAYCAGWYREAKQGTLERLQEIVPVTEQHIDSAISKALQIEKTKESIFSANYLRSLRGGEFLPEQKRQMRETILSVDTYSIYSCLGVYNPKNDWTEEEKPKLRAGLVGLASVDLEIVDDLKPDGLEFTEEEKQKAGSNYLQAAVKNNRLPSDFEGFEKRFGEFKPFERDVQDAYNTILFSDSWNGDKKSSVEKLRGKTGVNMREEIVESYLSRYDFIHDVKYWFDVFRAGMDFGQMQERAVGMRYRKLDRRIDYNGRITERGNEDIIFRELDYLTSISNQPLPNYIVRCVQAYKDRNNIANQIAQRLGF